MIARELGIAEATVEVYAIDCFAANAPLDKTMLARHMEVNPESFQLIKGAIEGCKDGKLRTVKDHLDDIFTYNQIRLVLACMIRDLDIDYFIHIVIVSFVQSRGLTFLSVFICNPNPNIPWVSDKYCTRTINSRSKQYTRHLDFTLHSVY